MTNARAGRRRNGTARDSAQRWRGACEAEGEDGRAEAAAGSSYSIPRFLSAGRTAASVVVVVRIGIVRLAAEIQVQVIRVGILLHRYEMWGLWMLVHRGVVLMLVLMFVRVRMGVIVRMRMLQIAVMVRVLVGVNVIVRVLMNMHVAVLFWMVVIVRHDQSSLSGSLQPSPRKRRPTDEITSYLRTARSPQLAACAARPDGSECRRQAATLRAAAIRRSN